MIKYEYFCGNDLTKLLEQVSDEIDETKIININKEEKGNVKIITKWIKR